MNKELKMQMEDIKNEMQNEILPYVKDSGVTGLYALQIAVRYGFERSKDFEWEPNDRAFGIVKSLIVDFNTPMNKFQRRYGKIYIN